MSICAARFSPYVQATVRCISAACAAAALLALTGCGTSPVQNNARQLGFGSTALLVGGSAAGGAIGNAIADGPGAVIGGAAGAAGTAVVGNLVQHHIAQAEAEAYAQGGRDARMQVMNDYWESVTSEPLSSDEGGSSGALRTHQTITYPAGTYEGVYYHTRTQNRQIRLAEPVR